jgi:hypothetical protein
MHNIHWWSREKSNFLGPPIKRNTFRCKWFHRKYHVLTAIKRGAVNSEHIYKYRCDKCHSKWSIRVSL